MGYLVNNVCYTTAQRFCVVLWPLQLAGSNKMYPDLWPDSANAHYTRPISTSDRGSLVGKKASRFQEASRNIDLSDMRWLVARGVITRQPSNANNVPHMHPNLFISIK